MTLDEHTRRALAALAEEGARRERELNAEMNDLIRGAAGREVEPPAVTPEPTTDPEPTGPEAINAAIRRAAGRG